jgi:hypothetical protein
MEQPSYNVNKTYSTILFLGTRATGDHKMIIIMSSSSSSSSSSSNSSSSSSSMFSVVIGLVSQVLLLNQR